MSVYLIPSAGEFEQINDVARKAGVPLLTPQSLREFILGTEDQPLVIVALRPQDLLILNRHAPSLVEELPTVVMSAPGPMYTGDWVTLASSLPSIDWTELERKLSKSGHLSVSPEQLADRGSRALETPAQAARIRIGKGGSDNAPAPDEDDPVVDADALEP